MVAQVAPVGMPNRHYSQLIIGGLWPLTDPGNWSEASEGLRAKASELVRESNAIRQTADGLPATDQMGDAVDGFINSAHDSSHLCSQHGEEYGNMATAADEVGRAIYGLREDLDKIDSEANAEIQRLIDEAKRSGHQLGLMAALTAKINEVIALARTAASAAATSATGHITSQLTRVTGNGTGAGPHPPPTVSPVDYHFGGGGGPRAPGRNGFPESPILGGASAAQDGLGSEPHQGGPSAAQDGEGSEPGSKPPTTGKTPSKDPGQSDKLPASVSDGGGSEPTVSPPFPSSGEPGTGSLRGAGSASPISASGSGGGLSMPSSSGMGSGLGGMSSGGPGLGSISPASGLGSGSPASGLTSPAGMGGAPGLGGAGPPAGTTDFSRGFNAGAASAGGAPLLPPPVAAQPSEVGTGGSGGPGGAFASGPAPVSMASGAPSAPPPALTGTGAPFAGAGGGGMPMSPLPPFNSDVPKPAPTASVMPASGPPVAPPPSATSASPGPSVAALPPGVLGSGVGAAAGAATSLSSPTEDPLLASASTLVYELAHASRLYGTIDWCVGIFKTPPGVETVVVSNEGAGFIPRGVFVPRSVQVLFCDSGLGADFRKRWFAWANPAQTMLAYANLLADHNPNIELYSLATSADHGGSALPARDAGVRFYVDCFLARSPIAADADPAPLDDTHMHRLETLDRGMYARLTGATGSAPDRSEAWNATVTGIHTALARAATVKEVVVAPEIRTILDVLSRGEGVPAEQWQALEFAGLSAVLQSASQRPGHTIDSGEASPFARAHHNLARAAELLIMWSRGNDLPYTEIAYTAAHIMSEAQLWPAADGY